MKKQLSSLELHYLVKEWQILLGGKIDMIYQKGKEELLLQFHVTNKGKRMLKVTLPSMIYLTEFKGRQPETPPGFCMFLRKYLKNARLQKLEQKGFERILDFTFSTKEKVFHLIIELFSDGNVILCDEKYKIISPLSNQNWKDRTIRGGIEYVYPKRELDLLSITYDDFMKAVLNSEKESIVKILALDFGLGGIYSEEVCIIAGISKDEKSMDDAKIRKLFSAIEEIMNNSSRGFIYEKDITPFRMKSFKSDPVKELESFDMALDEMLTVQTTEKDEREETAKVDKEKSRIQSIIDDQTKRAKEIEGDIILNTEKGEKIYQNYAMLKDMIDVINKARKTNTWDEIKEKLKDHKVIKMVDAKNKTVTVELT